MPCSDGGIPYYEVAQDTFSKTRVKLDFVTKLLCELCSKIEREDQDAFFIAGDLRKWWEEHKAEDLKRKLAVKRLALAKLSTEEIEILSELGVD